MDNSEIDRFDYYLPKTLTISSIIEEIERRDRKATEDISTFNEGMNKLKVSMYDLNTVVSSLREEVKGLKYDTQAVRVKLEEKANYQDLLSFKARTCTLVMHQDLRDQVDKLASKEELANFMSKQKELDKSILEIAFPKQEAISEFKSIRNELTDTAKKLATIEQTDEISDRIGILNTKLIQEMKSIRELIRGSANEFHKHLEEVKEFVNSKADYKEIEKVHDKMMFKASKETVERVYKETSSNISFFSEKIQDFSNNIIKQEEIVRRLDEVVLDKSSKVDILKLSKKIDKISRHPDLEDRIDQMNDSFCEILNKFNTQTQEQNRHTQLINKMMKFYNKKTETLSQLKLLQEKVKEIESDLLCKSNKNELLDCMNRKVEQTDMIQVQKNIDDVVANIKLVVSQIHTMQRVVADPERVRGVEKIQREYLSKTTRKLTDMIINKDSHKKTPESTGYLLSRFTARTPGRNISYKSQDKI